MMKWQKKDFTGEEMFRGIFFLQGDVVNHLESLHADLDKLKVSQKANPESVEYFESFVDEIVAQIELLDPDYFDNFKSQFESNNYYSIELALSNGTSMIKAAGLKSEELSGVFRLMLEIENKKVDFESEDMKKLDFKNQEDVAKLKSILKNDYSIDLDDEQYSVACVPVAAVCVVYAAAAVVSVAAVAYTAVAAVNATAWVTVYAWVEVWGGTQSQPSIASNNVLVKEIANF
ncbi:MAG: hypothetical protein AAF600_18015 [Bacteroidota bacterium]